MKFLIDECLTVQLVTVAGQAGFEAYHVAHVGKAGWKDRHVMQHAREQDFVLVTNNAVDFRQLYATQPLHAGLVIFNSQRGWRDAATFVHGRARTACATRRAHQPGTRSRSRRRSGDIHVLCATISLKKGVREGTVRIENETTPVNATKAKGDTSRTADPAFGIWRDHEITANVDAYVQELRAPRYRRDGTRNDD